MLTAREPPEAPPRARIPALHAGLALLGLLVLALVVYGPALRGALLWDDAIIFDDAKIRTGSSPWTWWFSLEHTDYWPVTYTVFWALYKLFGADPLPYHLVNIALHVANAALVGVLLRRLGTVAWPAVLLFLLHPVQVETTAYIFQLKTLGAATFVLLAVLGYLRHLDSGRPTSRWLALSVLAFALSLLTKTSTAMLPAVLVLHGWWTGRRSIKGAWVVVPYLVVAVVLVGLTLAVNARTQGTETVWAAGLLERTLTAARNVWFYLGKLVCPVGLSAVYPRVAASPSAPLDWLPLVAAAAATALVMIGARTRAGRVAALGLGWFMLNLAPALGFTNVYYMKYALVADHWQYLASIGVLGLASPIYVGLTRAVTARGLARPRLVTWLVAGLLLAAALASWSRARVFADSRALWQDTVQRAPTSALAHDNWGVELFEHYDVEGAIAEFRRAIALMPAYDEAEYNLGFVLDQQGQRAEAEAHYRAAIAATPDHYKALTALGALLLATGRPEEAERHLRAALAVRPSYADALSSLAVICTRTGRDPEARTLLERAIAAEPAQAQLYVDLGAVLLAMHEDAAAEPVLLRALALAPRHALAHFDLGVLYARQPARLREAEDHLRAGLAVQPDNEPAVRLLRQVQARRAQQSE